MLVKISPKERWIRSDIRRADRHQELVMHPEFLDAIETALLQYQINLGASTDPTTLATTGLRLDGARSVLGLLLNLGVQDPPAFTNPMPDLIPT